MNVVGLDFPECKSVIADFLGLEDGSGPSAKTQNFGRYRSGFPEPETGVLIGLIVWKDHQTVWPQSSITIDVGAVIRVDTVTRDRTIISGRYNNPETGIETVGEGPVLSYPFEVQKGPDGNYYVASYGYNRIDTRLTPTVDIIRVDPTTGDREYVCSVTGDLQLQNLPPDVQRLPIRFRVG
ncbi:MAG: hypothetical protein ACI9OJ_000732 [Myxococcota bacterium]